MPSWLFYHLLLIGHLADIFLVTCQLSTSYLFVSILKIWWLAIAKQFCNQAEHLSSDQNFNVVPPSACNLEISAQQPHRKPTQRTSFGAKNGAEATKIDKQMQQKIAVTLKKRQKEKNRRKLKRMKLGTMKKKINL